MSRIAKPLEKVGKEQQIRVNKTDNDKKGLWIFIPETVTPGYKYFVKSSDVLGVLNKKIEFSYPNLRQKIGKYKQKT